MSAIFYLHRHRKKQTKKTDCLSAPQIPYILLSIIRSWTKWWNVCSSRVCAMCFICGPTYNSRSVRVYLCKQRGLSETMLLVKMVNINNASAGSAAVKLRQLFVFSNILIARVKLQKIDKEGFHLSGFSTKIYCTATCFLTCNVVLNEVVSQSHLECIHSEEWFNYKGLF